MKSERYCSRSYVALECSVPLCGSPDSSVPAELLHRYFHKDGPATAQCGGVFHVDGTHRRSNVSEHVNINRAFCPS